MCPWTPPQLWTPQHSYLALSSGLGAPQGLTLLGWVNTSWAPGLTLAGSLIVSLL